MSPSELGTAAEWRSVGVRQSQRPVQAGAPTDLKTAVRRSDRSEPLPQSPEGRDDPRPVTDAAGSGASIFTLLDC